jgi:hypothetical protein
MKLKIFILLTFSCLLPSRARAMEEESSKRSECGRILSNDSILSGSIFKDAVGLVSQVYREDPLKIHAALLGALKSKRIHVADVAKIDYQGSLETMPPWHEFNIYLKDSSVIELSFQVR